jgi:hypothetical protein
VDSHGSATSTAVVPYGAKRSKTISRTIYATAKSGPGGIAVVQAGCCGVNDLGQLAVSDDDYTGNSFEACSVDAGYDPVTQMEVSVVETLPVAYSDLAPSQCYYRVVSAGLRVSYNSSMLSMEGMVYGITDMSGTNLSGKGLDYISNSKHRVVCSVHELASNSDTGGCIKLFTVPAVEDHQEFKPLMSDSEASAAYPLSPEQFLVDGTEWAPNMGFIIKCAPGLQFSVEYTVDIEYSGQDLDYMLVDNPVPPAGAHNVAMSALHKAVEFHASRNGLVAPKAVVNYALKTIGGMTGIPIPKGAGGALVGAAQAARKYFKF